MQNGRVTRREFLATAAAGGAALALPRAAGAEGPPSAKPNILFILADDFGIDGVGAYGGPYATPAIDRLAASGVRFEWAYCTPVCGPTRAQLMTGQYPFRNGAIDIDGTMRRAVPPRVPSLPALLKSAGYATGMAGKWRQVQGTPGEWGFDRWLMSPTANGYYWQKTWIEDGREIVREKETYFPDETAAYARRFIREHKEAPFFFYYAMTTPHTPIERTPDTAPGTTDPAQLYADNIAYADKQVRLLLEELGAQGLRENTLVIFSGDNGSLNRNATVGGRRLLGGKVQMNNGGAHVPLIACWPRGIPGGRTCADLVDFSDVLPTLAEVAGAALPADHVCDGRSFLPQLLGELGHPREWVFVQMGQHYFARNRGWQLNESGVLFDLASLPYEARPVPPEAASAAARKAREELQAALDRLNPRAGETWEKWTGFGNRGPGKKPPPGAGGYELQGAAQRGEGRRP